MAFFLKGKIRSRGSYTDLASEGIDLVSLLSASNNDDDDNDSAIDDDSEPVQPIKMQNVVLRRGNGTKGVKAINRWSTASSIDIEADFEVMANKVITKYETYRYVAYSSGSCSRLKHLPYRQEGFVRYAVMHVCVV